MAQVSAPTALGLPQFAAAAQPDQRRKVLFGRGRHWRSSASARLAERCTRNSARPTPQSYGLHPASIQGGQQSFNARRPALRQARRLLPETSS